LDAPLLHAVKLVDGFIEILNQMKPIMDQSDFGKDFSRSYKPFIYLQTPSLLYLDSLQNCLESLYRAFLARPCPHQEQYHALNHNHRCAYVCRPRFKVFSSMLHAESHPTIFATFSMQHYDAS